MAFSPTDIAGCQFWIDSSDASTFTFGVGTAVAQWNDKSGNGRNVTQAVAGVQPSRSGTQNGKATVVFPQDRSLSATYGGTSQPLSVIGAVKYTNLGPANRQWWGNSSGNQPTMYVQTDWRYFAGSVISSGVTADGLWHVHVGAFNGASSVYYLDDTSIATGNPGTQLHNFILIGNDDGGSFGWSGEIAEVILYNSVLSTSNRQAVEGYLQTKWVATPVSVDVPHTLLGPVFSG